MSHLTFAMSTVTRNFTQTSSFLISGQHYLETFMPLSNSNQDHTFMGDYIIPVLKQQTRLLLRLQRRIFTRTFSISLTVDTHIPHRHLAAMIPSQLNNYFLPSFLRVLQHKGILHSGCHLWRFRNYQRTPNRMLTRRLPDTKYINASPRIRLHASIRLKSEKRKIIKCKVANEKRSRQN